METPLRILLFGFYGVGELCDDFMADATKQTFEEVSDRPIQWVSTTEPADLVILGGGSLLGENLYLDQLADMMKQRDCPFAIFGTGVRDLEKGKFLPTLQYLWDRASSISIRGETSRQRLRDWGLATQRIQTLGDPIFLTKPLGLKKKGYIGGVIRPTPYSTLEWMKNAFEFLRVTRNQPVKLFSFCEAQGDAATNRSSGYESHVLDAAQTHRGIAESSFWFGNRLHAFCLALIEGVPTIGVEVEFRKVEDVCSILGYPHWIHAGDAFEQTYFDLAANSGSIYAKVARNIVTIRTSLRSQAQQILGMV